MPGGKRIMSHLDVFSPHPRGDDDSPGAGKEIREVDMGGKHCWPRHEPLGAASVAALRAGVSEPSIHMYSYGTVLGKVWRIQTYIVIFTLMCRWYFQYLCPIKIY